MKEAPALSSRRRRGEDHDHPCFEGAEFPSWRWPTSPTRAEAASLVETCGAIARAPLAPAASLKASPAGEALGALCGRRRRG
ncbi:MAG: hypothetical protein ACLT98_14430 [Eggerthellaceae bacterium]